MTVLNQIRVNWGVNLKPKTSKHLKPPVLFCQCLCHPQEQECLIFQGIVFWDTVHWHDIFVLELPVCQSVYHLHSLKCADQIQVCRIEFSAHLDRHLVQPKCCWIFLDSLGTSLPNLFYLNAYETIQRVICFKFQNHKSKFQLLAEKTAYTFFRLTFVLSLQQFLI